MGNVLSGLLHRIFIRKNSLKLSLFFAFLVKTNLFWSHFFEWQTSHSWMTFSECLLLKYFDLSLFCWLAQVKLGIATNRSFQIRILSKEFLTFAREDKKFSFPIGIAIQKSIFCIKPASCLTFCNNLRRGFWRYCCKWICWWSLLGVFEFLDFRD